MNINGILKLEFKPFNGTMPDSHKLCITYLNDLNERHELVMSLTQDNVRDLYYIVTKYKPSMIVYTQGEIHDNAK